MAKISFQADGPDQNIVYVKSDWSGLESTVMWLEDNPEVEMIVNNNKSLSRPIFEAGNGDVLLTEAVQSVGRGHAHR